MSRSSPNSKIVVGVDDAPENLALLEAAVRAGGFNFIGASSGLECLSLLARIEPRLVLVDIEMPDMNGFEVCRRIRLSPEMRHVPVAFLTARRTAEDVRNGMQVGGNDFIVKPFDVIKLLERIRHWTSRKL
ncbi:MAG TPA: response regulator [Stellaceae bacterium]|nr:response regulator [Stellaceae bacterium]